MCLIRAWVSGVFSNSTNNWALNGKQPFLIDQAAGFDLATAQGGSCSLGNPVVVGGNHAAFLHIDQHHLQRCNAVLAGDRMPRAIGGGA